MDPVGGQMGVFFLRRSIYVAKYDVSLSLTIRNQPIAL